MMYCFGAFQVEPRTHELRRSGIRIKIQEQSVVVLLKLLEHPGELVTREQLRAALWPADTFVDFDTGLNTVIKRLREVLRDSADGSQFIETVPKLGYRFIAPVQVVGDQQPAVIPPKKPAPIPGWRKWAAGAAVLVAACGMTVYYLSRLERQSGTTVEVVPLTGRFEMEDSPAFSPDGNQVTFKSSNAVADGSEGLYTTMIGGEKPLRLTSSTRDCCPAWSPDARSVAFARGHPGGRTIYVVPALGGTPKELYSEESVFEEHISMLPLFSWSPDGSYLAVSALSTPERRPTITLVSLRDSSRQPITSPPPEYSDWCPAFSPDGKSIAFLRASGPGLVDDLYVVPTAGGKPERLTSDNRPMEGPLAWTPDSREIIFSSDRSGLRSLWRISAYGGTPRRVEGVGTRATAPAIAPIGNRLAYTSEVLKVNLWKLRLADTKHAAGPPQLILPSAGFIGLASFSPDGQKLAFESSQSGYNEIWTAGGDGSNPVQLTFLKGVAGTPRWSNDGRSVAFDYRPNQHSEIYRVDLSGGPPRFVPTIPGADNVVPSWSRDGKWIYFSSNRGNEPNQVWKVPDSGGTPVQLTSTGGTLPNEGTDGFVYYSKSFRSDEIWKVPPGGGEETRVMKVAGLDSWSWALGSTGIYFITDENGGKGTLFFYDFNTSRVVPLMPFEKRVVEPALSPDGKSLVFFQIDQWEQTIMLVNHFR
jgi:Tol biopolymer transport system component/DNA-binding winged helix-turn-helix (wHTH) protein